MIFHDSHEFFIPEKVNGFHTGANGFKLHCEIIELHLKHTWTIARGSSDSKKNVFVTIEKDDVTGYGEAAPNIRYDETAESCAAVIERARPLFQTHDPWHIVDFCAAIQRLDAGQSAAKAALDMALLDWITKSLELPLFKYFGLDKNKTPVTTYSIGIDTPEMIQQKIQEAEDYPIYKIKVGLEKDAEIIQAVRSVSDKPLRVDANEGWQSKEEALEKIRWLQTQNVELIEQPLPAAMLAETRWLRERVQIPIIADESVKKASDIANLATAFDGINIKIMKSGGLQEALRMIWVAKSLGMSVMLGCMVESSLAISAAASLSPLVDFADLDGNLLIKNDPFAGIQVRDGKIMLVDKSGLGAQPR
ncbi:MAG: dipeptide epimerase [bacterium]